jgi:predicted DNA-binding transcriptional regulator AlpA
MIRVSKITGAVHPPSQDAGMSRPVPTVEEVRSWPVTVDIRTAGRAFGLGRDQAYRLAREGRFPVPVLRLGRHLRVTRAALLEALGVDESPARNSET